MSEKNYESMKQIYNQNIITFTTVLILGKILIFGDGGIIICALAGIIMGIFYDRIRYTVDIKFPSNDNKTLIAILTLVCYVLIKRQPAIVSFILLLALSILCWRFRVAIMKKMNVPCWKIWAAIQAAIMEKK